MERIGFLFLHPFSESLGSTTRVLEIARSLDNKGFGVIIYDPFENNREIDSISVRKLELYGPFSFLSKKVYQLLRKVYYSKKARRITANKIFQENTFYREIAKRLTKKIKEDNIQTLIVEQDAALVPGILAAEKTGIPVIVDLHNIAAEELVAARILGYESEEYKKMQNDLENLLQKVDGVIVVSEALKNYVQETYGVKHDIIIVPPSGRPRIEEIPERPNPYKIIYAGLIAYRARVEIFVKSIPYLKERTQHVEIYMTEKGEELRKIKEMNNDQKLGIQFFWFDTRNELFEFMKLCYIGILTSSRNKARELGPPVKLFDYMSVGLPVVANYIGGWSKIIKREKIGVTTDDDPRNFADGIYQLIYDEDLYYKYANNALNAVREKYNWDKATEPLVSLIKKML